MGILSPLNIVLRRVVSRFREFTLRSTLIQGEGSSTRSGSSIRTIVPGQKAPLLPGPRVITRMHFHDSHDITANRHGGNPESKGAFAKIEDHIAAQTSEVLALYEEHPEGLIGEEVERLTRLRRSSVSARLSELRKRGLLIRKWIGTINGKIAYERRSTSSGATAAVLVLNPRPPRRD